MSNKPIFFFKLAVLKVIIYFIIHHILSKGKIIENDIHCTHRQNLILSLFLTLNLTIILIFILTDIKPSVMLNLSSSTSQFSTTSVTNPFCYPVCGMVHIKDHLLLIEKNILCTGISKFSLLLSELSFTI